ncbi:VapB-like antitoxin [Sulfurisphaera ohwakuensis]|uniref:VapB-like antitoxin n=1 Tax=Sulfurisphaera ohwakuensis TaxID=69656 RepID=UPI0036F1CFEA
MKLAINYRVKGINYRLVINAEKFKVYEELDNVLKEICEKFNGEVEEYSVSKITEEIPLGKIITPIAINTALHSSDIKFSDDNNLNFIIKMILGTSMGLVIGHLIDSFASREEKVIEVNNPCERKEPNIFQAISEWNE